MPVLSFKKGSVTRSVFNAIKRFGSKRLLGLKKLKPRTLWRFAKKGSAHTYHRFTGGVISGPKTLADNIRYFANPGPSFEEADAINGNHIASKAKTIAFYLPQFHAFDENDQWWGTGFTEWRNVARGTPRFKGHYQPRVPRDLGFYDLGDIDTIAAQCKLAKHNGIEAFCFYYYWFNGKRLMEKPLDLFADSSIDQEFCIMWANENWTRTWDGLENDVLIKQDYLQDDEDDFIADTARYMRDERYVRLNEQPLFILYRPALVSDPKNTIARWREKWTETLGETPLIMMVQGFGEEDPRDFGLDGAVEFPPHKVCAGLDNINDRCQILDSNYQGLVRSYEHVVNKALSEPVAPFPLIRTVSPHWDNDARREGLGMTIHGSTPALYEKWLTGATDYAVANPVNDEPVVFVNAWNEWAEGAYLEPDVHYGHAYLNATKRVVKSLPDASVSNRLLLVGHDAHKHGAQMLLINIAKTYVQSFGMDIVILLKDGGSLLADYQKIAPTYVLTKMGKNGVQKLIQKHDFKSAICNTTVTGDIIPALRREGLQVISLVHEMPNLIRDYQLETRVQTIAQEANHIVYAANRVQQGFQTFTDKVKAQQIIKPQGTYTPIEFDAAARDELRMSMGISASDSVVIGVGYADLRKGFDLFMDAARRTTRTNDTTHFVWVGSVSTDMKRWIETDFSAYTNDSRIHIVGFTDRVKDYYSIADCLFLSSREDPYPTVVLEAMHIGLPVVAYEGTTGFDALLSTMGYLVEYGDSVQLDNAIETALIEPSNREPSSSNSNVQSAIQRARQSHVEQNCQFDDYCFELLELLHTDLRRVSVVIPNYNYAHYLEQRLTSVFTQNMPVFEVIVLDDNSTDDSVSVVERIAQKANRTVRVISNNENSGSVFKQWERAAQEVRGDAVWIAEADDGADALFLKSCVDAMDENTAIVFCDSKQIDSNGKHLSKSYQHYLNQIDAELFSQSFTMPGRAFAKQAMSTKNPILNVSGVLWDKVELQKSLASVSTTLNDYRLVGDWRVYLEALKHTDCSVAYVNDALNIHRRHDESVTQTLNPEQHVSEIAAIHEFVVDELDIDQSTKAAMRTYLLELCNEFGVDEASAGFAGSSHNTLQKAS